MSEQPDLFPGLAPPKRSKRMSPAPPKVGREFTCCPRCHSIDIRWSRSLKLSRQGMKACNCCGYSFHEIDSKVIDVITGEIVS